MFEMPRTGKNHCHAEFVAGGDHFRIAFGPPRLNDRFDPGGGGNTGDIIKRKKRLAREDRAGRTIT